MLCQHGFSPSMGDILDLVKEYLELENKQNLFKNGRPGKNWLSCFMKRNHLSFKKGNLISRARKVATANPFVIYNFYDMLENVIKSNNLISSFALAIFEVFGQTGQLLDL